MASHLRCAQTTLAITISNHRPATYTTVKSPNGMRTRSIGISFRYFDQLMHFRISFFVLLAALAAPPVACAEPIDYFTYIPAVGNTVSFSLTPSQIYNISPYYAVDYQGITYSNGTIGGMHFLEPGFSQMYGGHPSDFSISGNESSPGAGNAFGGNFDGPKLFSNDVPDPYDLEGFAPAFIPGVYQLTSYPNGAPPLSAILCIDISPCASQATNTTIPEPPSLHLFGIGLIGALGVVGRLRKA